MHIRTCQLPRRSGTRGCVDSGTSSLSSPYFKFYIGHRQLVDRLNKFAGQRREGICIFREKPCDDYTKRKEH